MSATYTETVCGCNTSLAIPRFFALRHHMPMWHLQRLAKLRKAKGFTQASLAERLGVEQPTVQRWETGKREPDLTQLMELAKALDVDPSTLIDPEVAVPIGPRLFIKGEVAAGIWRPAFEMPEDDWQTFMGRADVTASVEHRFGLRVVGDSMNLLYPEGTILECVSLFGHAEAKLGRRVIVVRTNKNGDCEATVKELVEADDGLWLVPRSTNPAHTPIKLGDSEPDIVETRIAAIVVASVRPE